ncbi:MAG TPA: glutathione S-transferase family protein [Anaeromyxobacteraceae bacterium]|nr:glutathione S-transferase family protein [Anaeromyxobacteraceae bacterium]
MKLYYAPATRATRPRWLLEEMGVPYQLVRLDPKAGETRTPEHLARHPLGHVPVLEDGEVRLFESAAICLWLAERFPEKGMIPPPGTPGRALAYQWVLYAMTELEPPVAQLSALARAPEGERDEAAAAKARERFQVAVRGLEPTLAAQPYLLGDAFTVADLIAAACVSWGRARAGALEGAPAVEAWLAEIRRRPAWRRATAD